MKPGLISIILGLHAYSVEPEEESNWCRVFLLIGLFVGFWTGAILMSPHSPLR